MGVHKIGSDFCRRREPSDFEWNYIVRKGGVKFAKMRLQITVFIGATSQSMEALLTEQCFVRQCSLSVKVKINQFLAYTVHFIAFPDKLASPWFLFDCVTKTFAHRPRIYGPPKYCGTPLAMRCCKTVSAGKLKFEVGS